MNLIAMKLGYRLLKLYNREGESRKIYINAMRSADSGKVEPLSNLIANELTAF